MGGGASRQLDVMGLEIIVSKVTQTTVLIVSDGITVKWGQIDRWTTGSESLSRRS